MIKLSFAAARLSSASGMAAAALSESAFASSAISKPNRRSPDAQIAPMPEIALDQRAHREVLRLRYSIRSGYLSREHPTCTARAPFVPLTQHAGPATRVPFRNPLCTCRVDSQDYVLRLHRHGADIGQGAIEGLRHHRA